MPTAWGSDSVNGQLVPRVPSSAIFPLVFSAAYTGPAMYPKQGTFQVPPVLPNAYSSNNSLAAGQFGNATPMVGGTTSPTSMSETGNPWHPTKSPLLFAFGALVLGLFMLHYIHW
jgi:hypothetical protein